MFNNVGTGDRLIRLLLASTLAYLGLFIYSGSVLGTALVTVAAVLTLSAVLGSCMLYGLLKINTRQ